MDRMLFKILTCLSLGLTPLAGFAYVRTPSGQVYTKENPRLEFNYLKTYNKPPKEAGSQAMETFPLSKTTFVYAQTELKNLLHGIRDEDYALTYKYIGEDGRQLSEFTINTTIKKEWETALFDGHWGWEEPGHWTPGKYRVEVWINKTKFAVKDCRVTGEKE